MLSHVQFFVTPWTVAHQAPPVPGISQARMLSGLPFPSQGDLPDSGIEPMSLVSPVLAARFFTTSTSWKAPSAMWQTVTFISLI